MSRLTKVEAFVSITNDGKNHELHKMPNDVVSEISMRAAFERLPFGSVVASILTNAVKSDSF